MKLKSLTVTAIVGAHLTSLAYAADESSTNSQEAEIAALKKELQVLEQKVESLERQQQAGAPPVPSAKVEALDQEVRALEKARTNDLETAEALARKQPKISLNENGFAFSSSDSNFVAQLHGVVQLDSRSFLQSGANGGSGFLLRRARPILSGTVFRDFDYYFMPDFGGSGAQIFDAYVNYHYNAAFQLEAGKFKAPIGLEALVADRDLLFNERSIATDLTPNRDLGVMFHGEVLGGAISYALGLFNGDTDYNGTTVNTPIENDKAIDGRLFFQPWKETDVNALRGLGFGVAGSYLANHPPTNSATGLTPGYTTDGQQKFFLYNNGVNAGGPGWRISPQAYYYHGPLGLLAEYVISDQQVASAKKSADLRNSAWEVTGSWVLTGENASYDGVTPQHPFDPRNGSWGAWQLLARCGSLSVDGKAFADGFANPATSADGAFAWSVGLDWYLNRNVRAGLSFSRTIFEGFTGNGSSSAAPARAENIIFSRLQIAF